MDDAIISTLCDIGLTRNEAHSYTILLRNPDGLSANELASKTGMHRQVVYDSVERLLEKGFANFVIENKVKRFFALEPSHVLSYLHFREENFRKILPELLKSNDTAVSAATINVFRGKNAVRTIYHDIIHSVTKDSDDILISGVDEKNFMEEDRIALEQHLIRLRQMKKKERILLQEGDRNFVKGDQTVYRWIPRDNFNPIPTFVYGNNIAILIWSDPNYSIIIHNIELAKTYRKQFNLLWKIAKEVK